MISSTVIAATTIRRLGRRVALLGVAVLVVVGAGCSDDADDPIDEQNEDPATTPAAVLDRIDGPAQVDPSYDPFATDG